MRPEPTLGIVADDLTGANDTLVQFAEAGFLARLNLDGPNSSSSATSPGCSAVATVTDVRPLDPTLARSRTSTAVEQLVRDGINHLYVKIDSTMRGSIAGQIAGALGAWAGTHPHPFAVVCPAYPAMGRVVDGGRLLVHGQPVELSPAGTDPVTPVLTSGMHDLLPGAAMAALSSIPAEERANALSAAAEKSTVVVVDAVTQADLEVLAAALLEVGPRAVPVGSAGLAASLAGYWAVPAVTRSGLPTLETATGGRTLVVVSSLHAASREQAEILGAKAPAAELLTLRPALDNLRTGSEAAAWAEAALPSRGLPATVMVLSPSRADLPDHSQVRSDGARTSAAVADGLATLTTVLMDHCQFSNLVLMGGDGARAVLRACDAESVTVKGAVQEGVPLGVVNGGRADGIRVVTKAGGFGKPESLVHILRTLSDNTHPMEASS